MSSTGRIFREKVNVMTKFRTRQLMSTSKNMSKQQGVNHINISKIIAIDRKVCNTNGVNYSKKIVPKKRMIKKKCLKKTIDRTCLRTGRDRTRKYQGSRNKEVEKKDQGKKEFVRIKRLKANKRGVREEMRTSMRISIRSRALLSLTRPSFSQHFPFYCCNL